MSEIERHEPTEIGLGIAGPGYGVSLSWSEEYIDGKGRTRQRTHSLWLPKSAEAYVRRAAEELGTCR